MPSVSKNQQKFMGMVHGLQKGEIDPKDVSQDVRDAAKSMKKKDAKDFASTKHAGLPTKVTEGVDDWISYISDRKVIDTVFKKVFGNKLKNIDYDDKNDMVHVSYDIHPREILKFAGERTPKIREVQKLLSKIYKRDVYVMLYTRGMDTLGYGIGSPINEMVINRYNNIDELFEQTFNESGFPDRLTPTDSFTKPDEDLIDFNKERNERIKKEIVRRLKEANLLEFPQNWLDGRSVTNQHTAKKTSPRSYDNDETNFKVKYSGQPDLESDLDEHHEEYPDEILQMSVGDFLNKAKEKHVDLYHDFEDVIDKYVGGNTNESKLNEGYTVKAENPYQFINGALAVFTAYLRNEKYLGNKEKQMLKNILNDLEYLKKYFFAHVNKSTNESILKEFNMLKTMDDANDKLRIVGSYLWDKKHPQAKKFEKLFNELERLISRRELANMNESFNLGESAMGELSLMAQEAPNFKAFLQDVFKEFRDLEKTKEAINWLKSIYDSRTDESVNEGWKDWFKKKSNPKVDNDSFKQQVLNALAKALKDDEIYPGEIEEWLETKVTHRYGGYPENPNRPERLSAKDMFTAKGFIQDWERYSSKNDTKGVELSKKNLYNHLKRTLKESVVDESISININTLPELVPGNEITNRNLKQDIADALNNIYKKYGIGISIKPR